MCVPRKLMPQVDMKDQEALLLWLDQEHNITGNIVRLPISTLRMEQCLHGTDRTRNKMYLEKPLFVSSDYALVDGNGRYLQYLHEGHKEARCYFFDKPFVHVTLAILTFPKAYRLTIPQPGRM